MATDKNQHLDCVLKSHKMSNVQELMDKYIKKRDEIKEALDTKYSSEKCTSPINSGSYAKHTAINKKFDIDICIPFKRKSFETLEEMADDLFDYFDSEYEDDELELVRKQRVSIGLIFKIDNENIDMDVVPGRELTEDTYNETNNLNLYVREKNGEAATSTQTNIKKHIETISGKNAERETIRLLKIWKVWNNKKYKSFFLELITIRAFENTSNVPSGIWNKLKMVMEYICDNVETIKLKDPANSNNIVSNTLSDWEKKLLSNEMETMLNNIEANSDYIKTYFPVNTDFPCEDEEDKFTKEEGASILTTKSFG